MGGGAGAPKSGGQKGGRQKRAGAGAAGRGQDESEEEDEAREEAAARTVLSAQLRTERLAAAPLWREFGLAEQWRAQECTEWKKARQAVKAGWRPQHEPPEARWEWEEAQIAKEQAQGLGW